MPELVRGWAVYRPDGSLKALGIDRDAVLAGSVGADIGAWEKYEALGWTVRPVLVIPLAPDGTVPEEIVERVAKAYWGTRVATRGRMWSAATPSAKHAALDQARAALVALSAPGDG
jgi:hypothetical protein